MVTPLPVIKEVLSLVIISFIRNKLIKNAFLDFYRRYRQITI